MVYVKSNGAKDYFFADSKCIGCGTCVKVCTAEKIKIIENKLVW